MAEYHDGKVCVVNYDHLLDIKDLDKVKCRDLPKHRHLSLKAAKELTQLIRTDAVPADGGKERFVQIRDAQFVGRGKRIMVFERARKWAKRMSGGCAVRQLVPGVA